ncbi:MAG: acyl-CoA thioesterase II [Gammaproteobacteria bacterium]|jgi:acyl-CoA thioesterase-2|nr:acyl-CoA thioesterase II [Gammaproteobacteria bacterium]
MQPLNQIIKTLDLEEIELNHYLATSPNEGWQRVYGGQVIGQALVAASRTVSPNRSAHSLHGYFLRAGDTTIPILYKVDRIRDGKSFTTRRVVAVQRGQAIFTMSISFQVDEGGLSHQFDMPKVPAPDSLPTEDELRREQAKSWPKEFQESFSGSSAIQVKPVDPVDLLNPEPAQAMQRCWMRCGEALPDDPRIHQCVLAYLSDWSLLDTASRPHAVSFMQDNVQVASLDHAMWFHRPFRADEWLLYDQDSPSASGARGFNRGLIYNQAGELVASTTQEGLLRVHAES